MIFLSNCTLKVISASISSHLSMNKFKQKKLFAMTLLFPVNYFAYETCCTLARGRLTTACPAESTHKSQLCQSDRAKWMQMYNF